MVLAGYLASLMTIAGRWYVCVNRISVLVRFAAMAAVALGLPIVMSGYAGVTAGENRSDRLKELQTAYVVGASQKAPRAYHFGSQGDADVFSNHNSHTNRLVPVYIFGGKAALGSVTGANSKYRNAERIKALYGFLPQYTVNPRADYADQSDLYWVQKEAISRGVKHLFIVWFDGLDWPTTQAAAIVKTGKVYREGKGSGLIFQDYDAGGRAQYSFVVTSPTHEQNLPNVDAQTVVIPPDSLGGGYDARIAGSEPWALGPLGPKARGYLKGQSASASDRAGVVAVGGVLHAYTDSSTSAAEMISGVKSYNNGLNITDDGRIVTTLFHQLQEQGWKVGTVTSVPFNHASPAAMYTHDVYRDDYQDLAREMLGLPAILQKAARRPTSAGPRCRNGDRLRSNHHSEVARRPRHQRGAGQLVHHRRRSRDGRRQERRQVYRGSYRARDQWRRSVKSCSERSSPAVRATVCSIRPRWARSSPLSNRRRPLRPCPESQ